MNPVAPVTTTRRGAVAAAPSATSLSTSFTPLFASPSTVTVRVRAPPSDRRPLLSHRGVDPLSDGRRGDAREEVAPEGNHALVQVSAAGGDL